MRKLAASGTCHSGDQGGMALVTVLGAMFLLIILAAGIATQTSVELKAASVEPEVAQRQILVWSGLQEAAQRVRELAADPAALEAYGTSAVDLSQPPPKGWTPCVPAPSPSGRGYLCWEPLYWSTGWVNIDTTDLEVAQIPVAIRWKIRATDPVSVAYGWVVADIWWDGFGNPSYDNVRVFFDHAWCRPDPNWDITNPDSSFCLQGG